MTALRLLAMGSGALVLAVAGAAVFPAHAQRTEAVRAPPAAKAPPAAPRAAPAGRGAATPAATTGPARPAPDLRDLPPGVLTRAAKARALDRMTSCAKGDRRDGADCTPKRDVVEVQWDVVRER